MATKKKNVKAKKSVTPVLPPDPSDIHKRNFDSAVKELETIRAELLKAPTFDDLSKADSAVRGALLTLQKYAMDLGYWLKAAVDRRREELRKEQ